MLIHRYGILDQQYLTDLNRVYRSEAALHSRDFSPEGFQWCDFSDWEQSVVSFVRKGAGGEMVFAVCNFTPVPRFGYRISVPEGGWWRELLNSDAARFVSGVCLPVDAGLAGGLATGVLNIQQMIAEASAA